MLSSILAKFNTSPRVAFLPKQALRQLLGRRLKHTGSIQMDIVQKRKALQQFHGKPEVTIFDRQTKQTYKWGMWVVAGQMLMWINFADFYWRYSMDKDETTGELTLSAPWKRACISAVAILAGVSIGGGILHYISRSIARVKVLDGQTVRIETYRITGYGVKAREYPITSLYSRDLLFTGQGANGVTKPGSPQYSIHAPGNSYAFIMNRAGWFKNPKMFDVLFHRSAQKA